MGSFQVYTAPQIAVGPGDSGGTCLLASVWHRNAQSLCMHSIEEGLHVAPLWCGWAGPVPALPWPCVLSCP